MKIMNSSAWLELRGDDFLFFDRSFFQDLCFILPVLMVEFDLPLLDELLLEDLWVEKLLVEQVLREELLLAELLLEELLLGFCSGF